MDLIPPYQRIGEYLVVSEIAQKPGLKTRRWAIKTNGHEVLGYIHWFGRWRQYVFDPVPESTYNAGCLTDIAAFLKRVTDEQYGRKRG